MPRLPEGNRPFDEIVGHATQWRPKEIGYGIRITFRSLWQVGGFEEDLESIGVLTPRGEFGLLDSPKAWTGTGKTTVIVIKQAPSYATIPIHKRMDK